MHRNSLTLVTLTIAVFIAIGCAGLGRRAEQALDRASIPVWAEDCQAEIALVQADIATSQAWITAAPSAKVILKLSDKSYDALMKEATDNLAFKQQRLDRLNAILPTLKSKPAPAPATVQ